MPPTNRIASSLVLCTCGHRRHSRSNASTYACVATCDSTVARAHLDWCIALLPAHRLPEADLCCCLLYILNILMHRFTEIHEKCFDTPHTTSILLLMGNSGPNQTVVLAIFLTMWHHYPNYSVARDAVTLCSLCLCDPC